MNCPVCNNVKLVMAERQGIEIDYCPDCRGVWLDRGELDKLIEKSAADAPLSGPQQMRSDPYREQQRPAADYGRAQYPQQDHYKKKHKGLLGELFDFD
jgi:Zn-finger nucleic acid-binding protein